MAIGTRSLLKAALLVAAGTGLSGCVYDVGLGYASNGYYDGGYGCDPYGGYDAYYECDYGQGYANIGFSGGYYDNFYYPGYGIFLFDNVGRRYQMREEYRRYWGEKRQIWNRERRAGGRDGARYDGRPHGYSNDGSPGGYGGNERNARRVGNRQGVTEQALPRRASAQVVSQPENVTPNLPERERNETSRAQPLGRRAPEGGVERPD